MYSCIQFSETLPSVYLSCLKWYYPSLIQNSISAKCIQFSPCWVCDYGLYTSKLAETETETSTSDIQLSVEFVLCVSGQSRVKLFLSRHIKARLAVLFHCFSDIGHFASTTLILLKHPQGELRYSQTFQRSFGVVILGSCLFAVDTIPFKIYHMDAWISH